MSIKMEDSELDSGERIKARIRAGIQKDIKKESEKDNFPDHLTEISKILHDSAMKLYREGHVVNGFAMTNPVFFKYHIYEDLKKVGAIDEKNKSKNKLLDLGCGNGCINIIASVLGIESVGIDNNEIMILESRENLKKLEEFHELLNNSMKDKKLQKASCSFIHGDFNSENSFKNAGHKIHNFDLIYSYVEESQAEQIVKFFKEKAHDNSRLILNVGGKRESIEKLAKKHNLKIELKFGEESAYFFFRKK